MKTYILLHGGWGGGWEWRDVADRLTASGHLVFRPSLTGLGDRSHLAREDVDLETHIQDVVALLESEALDDVVLCGHSYAGMVISGVADRVPGNLERGWTVRELNAPHDAQFFAAGALAELLLAL